MSQQNIRIAILAEDKAGFIKPMAEGLSQMLKGRGVEGVIFYQGLAEIDELVSRSLSTKLKNAVKSTANLFTATQHYITPNVTVKSHQEFIEALHDFDAVVVVCPLPRAFEKDSLSSIEDIRRQVHVPVVLYQNYFLATRGAWYEKIAAAGGEGLERFDWYLAATTVSEYPLIEFEDGMSWPVSTVGHDLRCDTLTGNWGGTEWQQKAKRSFKVLLDFPREGFEVERELQKEVLDKMGIEYTELCRRYSIAEIRQLYREHHAFMLSFRESFGLAIVENQLCGNWIFTPRKDWCPSHYLCQNFGLGDNFVVYDDKEQLELLFRQYLESHNKGYNYQNNCETFSQQYPYLYSGNKEALDDFISKIKSKEINSQSHLDFAYLDQFITKG